MESGGGSRSCNISCLTISVRESRVTMPTRRSSALRRIEMSASSIQERIRSWWSDTKSACVEVIFARARRPTYFTVHKILE